MIVKNKKIYFFSLILSEIALTVAECIYPGKFVKYARGDLLVTRWAAFSVFVPNPNGKHRIGRSIDKKAFLEWFSLNLVPEFHIENEKNKDKQTEEVKEIEKEEEKIENN